MHKRPRARLMLLVSVVAALIVALGGFVPGAAAAATADLSLAMTAAPAVVPESGTTSITVVVTNNGPKRAREITISAPFGKAWNGIACAADHDGVCQPYRYGYLVTFPSLAPGESATITFIATVSGAVASGNTVTATASVSAATDDPDGTNNSASASVLIQ
jgi:hypothetical protein